MNSNQKISFVMPAYNCADTIEESVDSIFNGNFEEGDEVIIVNDGSTDNTQNILLKLQKKYPQIKIISNPENKGCPATRNIGIKAASNPLIFNLDSDDILAKKSVPLLKKHLIENDADVTAFSEIHYFTENIKNVTHKWVLKPGILTLADYLAGPIVPGGNYLYTRASWEKIGGYWEEYGKGLHEFWGFSLKQLANGARFVVLPNSYYFHRYGLDSLFIRESRKRDEISLMATKMILNFIDLISDEDADYIRSEYGSKNWFNFNNFFEHPIKLKSGESGTTGYKIIVEKKLSLRKIVKKITPRFLISILKKTYFYYLYVKDFISFKKMPSKRSDFKLSWIERYPQIFDKTRTTNFDAHYIYHPAWAARILAQTQPPSHTDISSTLNFCSIVSAFIPVKFYDYRPASLKLSNLTSKKADLQNLPFENESINSLSCMHTIEHIGLGRYGDPIDPDGDLKAISELKRVLARQGNLLFVVPIGSPKIMYNAHRIYSYKQIMSYFSGLTLKEFSLIPDNAKEIGMIKDASEDQANEQNYGCGCFWFVKE